MNLQLHNTSFATWAWPTADKKTPFSDGAEPCWDGQSPPTMSHQSPAQRTDMSGTVGPQTSLPLIRQTTHILLTVQSSCNLPSKFVCLIASALASAPSTNRHSADTGCSFPSRWGAGSASPEVSEIRVNDDGRHQTSPPNGTPHANEPTIGLQIVAPRAPPAKTSRPAA